MGACVKNYQVVIGRRTRHGKHFATKVLGPKLGLSLAVQIFFRGYVMLGDCCHKASSKEIPDPFRTSHCSRYSRARLCLPDHNETRADGASTKMGLQVLQPKLVPVQGGPFVNSINQSGLAHFG